MKRSAFSWWEMVFVLVLLGILAAILFPLFWSPKTSSGRSDCQSNLKQVSLGISQYVQDYDSKYPLVNSRGQGWMDIAQPYLRSSQIFQCPTDNWGATQGKSDYFYNARLAGQENRKLEFAANTIMTGDGTPESPSNFSLTKLPPDWASDTNSPAWRHLEGANYSFADNHVKWLRPDKVTNQQPSMTVYTFAPW